MPPKTIRDIDVLQFSLIHGSGHKIHKQSPNHSPLAKGKLLLTKTLAEIIVHVSNTEELDSISVSCDRSNELTVGVLLEGKLKFALDDKEYSWEVKPGAQPICFAFNALRQVRWSKETQRGNKVKKSLVCIPHSWLKSRFRGETRLDNYVKNLMLHHNLVLAANANPLAQDLAKKLLKYQEKELSEIEFEGLGLVLVAECLKNLQNGAPAVKRIATNDSKVSAESMSICEFIEKNIIDCTPPVDIDLSQISKRLGLSISTAQRQFKLDFKMTIMEYIRSRRLEQARGLLQKNMSIGEAAYRAGYSHTSNFSLAFKKYFGITPGDITNMNCTRACGH